MWEHEKNSTHEIMKAIIALPGFIESKLRQDAVIQRPKASITSTFCKCWSHVSLELLGSLERDAWSWMAYQIIDFYFCFGTLLFRNHV